MILRVKDDSVNIWGLDKRMRPVLKYAAQLWFDNGQELVVTSARDGLHSPGSLHYYGLAVDLRTRYFTRNGEKDDQKIAHIAHELSFALRNIDERYQVIKHSTHIHVEFDEGF